MSRKILVVAAHPDDEVLGCGGAILKHIESGDIVHTIIMAEGLTSRDCCRDVVGRADELSELHQTAKKVADFMGVEKLIMNNFPDNRMDSVTLLDVVKTIESEVDEFQPDVVYTHHAGDVNVDHRVTHDAVITACRSLPGEPVREILFFETLSSTEWQMMTADKIFQPNVYVDITKQIHKKIKVLELYSSEMREYPHPRSYEGVKILAQYRGLTVGCPYGEAFMLGRSIR